MAVERVREGEAPSAVIASNGFCRTTMYKWLRKVRRGGRGDHFLRIDGQVCGCAAFPLPSDVSIRYCCPPAHTHAPKPSHSYE